MNEVYKTKFWPALIWEMVEIYCHLGKVQPWPIIHLGPTGLGE